MFADMSLGCDVHVGTAAWLQGDAVRMMCSVVGMGCTAGPTWGVSSSLPGAEQITDPRVREAIRNQQLR